jgi:plasmid stabilization system protein ParE
MTAIILDPAEQDLENAFNYYEGKRPKLGGRFIDEFRRGVELILRFPGGWQRLDETYRRYRLHRFPYGIIYRVDRQADQIVIVCVGHLSREPGWWRERDREQGAR